MDLFHKFALSLTSTDMEKLHYAIVSEEMVWLWYYDELGGKHIKELLDKEARSFIKSVAQTLNHDNALENHTSAAVRTGTDFV
jgi:hypothetical protein